MKLIRKLVLISLNLGMGFLFFEYLNVTMITLVVDFSKPDFLALRTAHKIFMPGTDCSKYHLLIVESVWSFGLGAPVSAGLFLPGLEVQIACRATAN